MIYRYTQFSVYVYILIINKKLIYLLNHVQVLRSTATFRAPDCFQRTPRKIQIPDTNGQILTLTIDTQGIHAIVKNGTKLSYVIYNICTGRVEQDNPFPSDTASFMGLHPQFINLTCAGEVISQTNFKMSI